MSVGSQRRGRRLASVNTLIAPLILLSLSGPLLAMDLEDIPTTHKPLVFDERETKAMQHMEEFETLIQDIRLLPATERPTAWQAMGRDLEKLVRRCTGTTLQNKAWYLMAQWHLEHGDGATAAMPFLTRIRNSEYPAYGNAARALEVYVQLEQGDIKQARLIAEQVSSDIPEFSNLLVLVSFYERIGQAAPRTAGRGIASGRTDPAESPTPWLLYCFCNLESKTDRLLVRHLANMLNSDDPEQDALIKLVLVSFSANPLAVLGHFRDLPSHAQHELLWANPGSGGDAEAWRSSWGLPKTPLSVLLGPDRRILAIEPGAKELGILLGREISEPEAETPDQKNPIRGRGKRFNWR